MRLRQVQIRVLVAIISVSAVFLVLLGVFAVARITELTRARVHTEALDLVALKAEQIEGFFAEHGRVVDVVFANPSLLAWFEGYDEFRRPLEDDETFEEVLAFFQAVVDADPAIASVFLATEATSEYFRESGRVEREGYGERPRRARGLRPQGALVVGRGDRAGPALRLAARH